MTEEEILERAREIEEERRRKRDDKEAARDKAEALDTARALLAKHDRELAAKDPIALDAEAQADRKRAERLREERATAGEQWKIGAPEEAAPPSEWIADPACSVQIGKFRRRGEPEGRERGIVLVALGIPDGVRVYGMEHDRALVIADALTRAAKAAADLSTTPPPSASGNVNDKQG